MTKGAPYILGKARLTQRIMNADLVITGEGRIDSQTSMGKAPQTVATIAKQCNVPVIAICGSMVADIDVSALGFKQIIPVTPSSMSLDIAIQPSVARANIAHAITKYFTKRDSSN